MSGWTDDPECFRLLDEWMVSQQKPMNEFMEQIMQYADDAPHWGMLVIYGKFVMHWNQLKEVGDMTETELFNEVVARIANDTHTVPHCINDGRYDE
jgi:hypothetical protein